MKYLIFLLISVQLSAATYYANPVTGSDSNPGTEAAPWKLAPGMTGSAAKQTRARK